MADIHTSDASSHSKTTDTTNENKKVVSKKLDNTVKRSIKNVKKSSSNDEITRKAFGSITEFIDCVSTAFGDTTTVNPLILYHRLIEHIKYSDIDSMRKSVAGFTEFFSVYNTQIMKNELDEIPNDANIYYSPSVYVNIGNIIETCDDESKEILRRHLLTISTIIEPDEKKIEELNKKSVSDIVDTSTKEGEFVNDIVSQAKNTMDNVDVSNPMSAIAGLFQSGIVEKMVNGLNSGVSSGQMDMSKLFGTMQSAIGNLMPPPQNADKTVTDKGSQDTTNGKASPTDADVASLDLLKEIMASQQPQKSKLTPPKPKKTNRKRR